ncbi:DUF6923 family protein [Amycolatopsis vastitatis]|uniref:DUF6923 domain-containing protein n=1 Tax=Amycolatopsis vastitatis TaxID=1905142 RepID=A0A229SZS0_9PSEU|nr:hypothetical protein [Amycolatopsis vastitatis]OXM64516.1 hypothetical protein CF165_26510 [Amycolatopsis vastitatis]
MTRARARWAAMFGVAAAVSALLAATGWLAPPASRTAGARQPDSCTVLQAETERDHAPTTLRLLSLPSGATQRVTEAGYWINAMGYSAEQDVVYGVADGTGRGRYDHGAHAVRIDSAGTVTDLGVLGRAGARHPMWSLVTGATAGTIDGNRWYVRQDSDLYTVDIDPASADYLRVVHRTALRPVTLAAGVDDFAYDPADGLLYGVSTTTRGGGTVVTLDPATGKVEPVPGERFPEGGAYGSVALGPGAIYATANRDGHRSVTYRLPRDGSGPAVEIATGPPLASSDAAGDCPTEPPPPPPSSPPPPEPPSSAPSATPTPTPTPPPSPTTPEPSPSSRQEPPPPPRPPPVERPVVLPPTTSTPAPAPPPSATPSPTPSAPATSRHARPAPKPQPVAEDTGRRTQEQRRWGLTALILVLGGGAAAAHVRRHR